MSKRDTGRVKIERSANDGLWEELPHTPDFAGSVDAAKKWYREKGNGVYRAVRTYAPEQVTMEMVEHRTVTPAAEVSND
jgi:hypothetical protein